LSLELFSELLLSPDGVYTLILEGATFAGTVVFTCAWIKKENDSAEIKSKFFLMFLLIFAKNRLI
jgi:hypothetical protein